VPFGTLVETGMIAPGTILTDAKRRWTAIVHADGSIERDGILGSIHKVGAEVQGAPACNGWMFWHIELDGALAPIDVLRQRHVLTLD
jgi:modification methylase